MEWLIPLMGIGMFVLARQTLQNDRNILNILFAFGRQNGVSSLRKDWLLSSLGLKGRWNGSAVRFRTRVYQSKWFMLECAIRIDSPHLLIIRHRAARSPALSPMFFLLTDRMPFLDPEYRNVYARVDNPELLETILSSARARDELDRNIDETDGFLLLEKGFLQVRRLFPREQAISLSETIRSGLNEEWALLRAVRAVLKPTAMMIAGKNIVPSACPYCKGPLTDSPDIVECPACGALHHQVCWQEYGQCSVYGCEGEARIALPSL